LKVLYRIMYWTRVQKVL